MPGCAPNYYVPPAPPVEPAQLLLQLQRQQEMLQLAIQQVSQQQAQKSYYSQHQIPATTYATNQAKPTNYQSAPAPNYVWADSQAGNTARPTVPVAQSKSKTDVEIAELKSQVSQLTKVCEQLATNLEQQNRQTYNRPISLGHDSNELRLVTHTSPSVMSESRKIADSNASNAIGLSTIPSSNNRKESQFEDAELSKLIDSPEQKLGRWRNFFHHSK